MKSERDELDDHIVADAIRRMSMPTPTFPGMVLAVDASGGPVYVEGIGEIAAGMEVTLYACADHGWVIAADGDKDPHCKECE